MKSGPVLKTKLADKQDSACLKAKLWFSGGSTFDVPKQCVSSYGQLSIWREQVVGQKGYY